MKKYIFLILSICSHSVFYAQTVKKTIGFIPFTTPDQAEAEYREMAYKNIYDAALRVFTNTQRFRVLDRGSFDIVKIEKEFQKGEHLVNAEIIEQGKIAAAELLAVAKLSTFIITESDDGDGFSVYITAEFKQIDVKTGEAIDAFQLRAEAIDQQESLGGKKRITSIEEAISKAVIKMESDLEQWIKSNFPMILEVHDIDEDDLTIMVEGGFDTGLNTRIKMKAIKLEILPDGKKIIRTIAKLNYTREGVGEDITILKVSSKKDWYKFLKIWQTDSNKVHVTEDI